MKRRNIPYVERSHFNNRHNFTEKTEKWFENFRKLQINF